MSELSDFNLPEEIEEAVKVIFSQPKPNPAFVDRLGHQLSSQVEQFTTRQRKVLIPVSPLAWGSIAIIFIALLVWGIKTLIPRVEPIGGIKTTPSPTVEATIMPTQAEGTAPSPIASPPLVIESIQTEGVEGTIDQPSSVRIPVPWPDEAITTANAFQLTQLRRFGRGPIQGVAWSPDDKTFAIASSTGIYLYETANFTEIKMITSNGGIKGIAYSPDGAKLAVQDGSNIKIWEIASGKVLHTLPVETDWPSNLVFSPDGAMLAGGSGDYRVKLWDLTSGDEIGILTNSNNNEMIGQLAFSSDGTMMFSMLHLITTYPDGRAAGPGRIRVWDITSRTILHTLPDCGGYAMALSPDNQTVFVQQEDTTVYCDINSGSVIGKLAPNAGRPEAFSPDGTILASVDYNTIRLWGIPSMEEVLTLVGKGGWVDSIAFSHDGRRLASASTSFVEIWDTATGQVLDTITGQAAIDDGQSSSQLGYGDVQNLAFSPDEKFLATLASGGPLKLYNMTSGILYTELETQIGYPRGVAFSQDGKLIAVWGGYYLESGAEAGVQIWDAATLELRLKLDRFNDIVQSVAFSPDGVTLATGEGSGYGWPGAAKLWNIATGELLQEFGIKSRPEAPAYNTAFDVAFSPDGSLLAVASGGGNVLIWNVSKQMHEAVLISPADKLKRVAFSPDGNLLAAAEFTGELDELRLWDLSTGKTLVILNGQSPEFAFSPDGSIFASANHDRGVQLWDAHTGEALATINGDFSPVAPFNPDGSILALASHDGGVELWDVHTGEALATINTDFSPAAFSPDGTLLVTVDDDDTMCLWGIPTEPPNIK